jgi:hypothetical protein
VKWTRPDSEEETMMVEAQARASRPTQLSEACKHELQKALHFTPPGVWHSVGSLGRCRCGGILEVFPRCKHSSASRPIVAAENVICLEATHQLLRAGFTKRHAKAPYGV